MCFDAAMSLKRARLSQASSIECNANDPVSIGDKAPSASIDKGYIGKGLVSDILIGDSIGKVIGDNLVIDESDSDNHCGMPSSTSNNKGITNDTVSQAKNKDTAKTKAKPKGRASRSKACMRRVDPDFNNHRSAIWHAFLDGNDDCGDDESDAELYYDAFLQFKNLKK